MTLTVFFLLLMSVHPFLAVTRPVPAEALVVEGWLHEFAIVAAAQEFKSGRYAWVFATGGPTYGDYTSDYGTYAHVCASALKNAGVPDDKILMAPAHETGRDRTYAAAATLRIWLSSHHMTIRKMNVLTMDSHARRSRLLFQKAFGDQVEVGIISAPNPDYDGRHWWRYSEGVREVLGEAIAYLYARFLFHPSTAP